MVQIARKGDHIQHTCCGNNKSVGHNDITIGNQPTADTTRVVAGCPGNGYRSNQEDIPEVAFYQRVRFEHNKWYISGIRALADGNNRQIFAKRLVVHPEFYTA